MQHAEFLLHTSAFTPKLLQCYIVWYQEAVSTVASGFPSGINESTIFWDFTQGRLVIADVSGHPIGSIFKGQAVEDECL
jgi:hypothetical protein